jgi:hypothetical protein
MAKKATGKNSAKKKTTARRSSANARAGKRAPIATRTASGAKPAASAKSTAARPAIAEHRIAVAGVAVHVRYGRERVEEFELRGTAVLNVGAPEAIVRTTGVVRLGSGKGESALAFNPASLNRNLVLSLSVGDADLALLREIFVTGTGSELSDPALTVWATTAALLAPDAAAESGVVEFGYSLDFDPAPALGSR